LVHHSLYLRLLDRSAAKFDRIALPMHAIPAAHTISIAANTADGQDRPLVRITVQDSGPGIASGEMSRLFVAVVTTKERGKGTGLGLRIYRRIVDEMGGEISATNRAEGGACFETLLPAAAMDALPRPLVLSTVIYCEIADNASALCAP
jgi:signal transduction histidine kinase